MIDMIDMLDALNPQHSAVGIKKNNNDMKVYYVLRAIFVCMYNCMFVIFMFLNFDN